MATRRDECDVCVRAHTIIGFLADPKYGGYRDHAGWRGIGCPSGSESRRVDG